MRVGPAVAERIDTRHARTFAARPSDRRARHVHRGAAKIDIRIQVLEVNAGKYDALIERQRCFDNAEKAGAGFNVAEIAFCGADIERLVVGAACAVDINERAHLDRIADRRACAMGLDITDIARISVNARQSQPYDFFLGLAIRRRKRRRTAILIDRGRDDASQNSIVARQSQRFTAQHYGDTAFAANIAVRRFVESLATAGP